MVVLESEVGETVLFLFDGSPRGEWALRNLCAQLRDRPRTEILAVNVLRMPPSMDLDAPWPEEDLSRLLLCHRADEIGWEEGACVFGMVARCRRLSDAVLGVACDERVSRIVLPVARGAGWWARRRARRETRRILRDAPCPVELVYLPEGHRPGAGGQRREAEETRVAGISEEGIQLS